MQHAPHVVPAPVHALIPGIRVAAKVSCAKRGSAQSSAPVAPLIAYILSAPTNTVPSTADTIGLEAPCAPAAPGNVVVQKIVPLAALRHCRVGEAVAT